MYGRSAMCTIGAKHLYRRNIEAGIRKKNEDSREKQPVLKYTKNLRGKEEFWLENFSIFSRLRRNEEKKWRDRSKFKKVKKSSVSVRWFWDTDLNFKTTFGEMRISGIDFKSLFSVKFCYSAKQVTLTSL